MRAVCLDIADLRDGRREPLSRTPTRHGQPAFLSLSTAWQCFTPLKPRAVTLQPNAAARCDPSQENSFTAEYEDSGHASPALVTAGIDPTRAAPSVDNKTGSCPNSDLGSCPAIGGSDEKTRRRLRERDASTPRWASKLFEVQRA